MRGMVRRAGVTATAMAVVATVGLSAPAALAATGTQETPRFPARPRIDNPLFPLVPGTTFVFDGTDGSRSEHETVVVMRRVKMIEGIPCLQVVDTNWAGRTIVESTLDWYAQDFDGNVWYMGEFATQYKHGDPVGHEGSWRAGKGGARAGIIMEAHPRVGDKYKQEDARGVAEDRGKVLAVDASVSTPYGTWINQVLVTKDFSKIEPAFEHKYYVPRIGLVKSADVVGGSEVMELTGIQHS
jgi:hypothetical protein